MGSSAPLDFKPRAHIEPREDALAPVSPLSPSRNVIFRARRAPTANVSHANRRLRVCQEGEKSAKRVIMYISILKLTVMG